MLAMICASDLLPARRQFFKNDFLLALATGVASCLNPRGIQFLLYIAAYTMNPVIGERSGEWRSIDLLIGPAIWTYLAMAGLMFYAVWLARKVIPIGEIAFLAALFVLSLISMRVIPYFALAVPIACAPAWKLLAERNAQKPFFKLDERLSAQEPETIGIAGLWAVVTAVIVIVFAAVPSIRITDFNKETMPIACSNYIKEHHLDGTGFNWDNWGPYLYWKLGRPIFIDDKTDFYPREFVEEYATLYFTHGGWERILAKWKFPWVLVQAHTPLAEYLSKDTTHWSIACRDPDAILFLPKR